MPQRLLAPGLGLLLLVLLEYSGLGTVLANNGLDLLFQLRGPRQPVQRPGQERSAEDEDPTAFQGKLEESICHHTLLLYR